MFNIYLNCQYEGIEERIILKDTINSLRKSLKRVESNSYSDTFTELKYQFFVSGEISTFSGESGVSSIRFYNSRSSIKVDVTVQKDISHGGPERINSFFRDVITHTIRDIVIRAESENIQFDKQILNDIEQILTDLRLP